MLVDIYAILFYTLRYIQSKSSSKPTRTSSTVKCTKKFPIFPTNNW